jgi:hypothetical protein
MGSFHGLSSVQNAPEPCGLALDPALALALPSAIKSKSKSKSRGRFMGSFQFHLELHNSLEPAGTFNAQRPTLNVQREQPVHGKRPVPS